MSDDTDTDTPLQDLLTYRISRLHARLNAHASGLLAEVAGISLVQWRVLVMLDAIGPSAAVEMVRLSAIDKGQLSRTVKIMQSDGLIVVAPGTETWRSPKLEMTQKGREIFERTRPIMRARQSHLTTAFPPEKRAALFEALSLLDQAVSELEAQR